jgi:Omp85 superfamily domain
MTMRALAKSVVAVAVAMLAGVVPVRGQEPEPATRQEAIEQAEAERARALTPQTPEKAEALTARLMSTLQGEGLQFHPFFQSAYSGGGFTLGAGYGRYVSPFNTVDVRGSYTIRGYKRIEAEFVAPRLFERRAELSVLGGWREATEVGFYGFGTNTSSDDRANYSFQQPYFITNMTMRPTRRLLTLIGTFEYTRWNQRPGEGSAPSVETVYTPADLPGLGAKVTYLHTRAAVGLDSRVSTGYARRGGAYGVWAHDYTDPDDRYGFQEIDYEAIQHLPILRDAWVLSLHALGRTTYLKDGQEIPFFMLPSVGGGSSLRGFSSWRFRDRNSLLLQAEWRIIVNRYLDTAFFYDAGKVASSPRHLDFDGLKKDWGFGARFHSPFATILRVELARSNEGVAFVFSSSSAF